MPQFNPNMSKEELVNTFSTDSPFLNTMSTNSAYTYIVNKYPQYKLDEEEKQYLEQNIQASLQQKELRVEDAIMVRSIKNIKLANRMLMLRRKEYMKDMAQKAKETAQANAEQQSRAAQTAAQAKAQEIQIKSQGEMESLKMEYQLRDQFEQRQHERKMKEIELQETIRGRFDKQEEQERTERKNVTAQ